MVASAQSLTSLPSPSYSIELPWATPLMKVPAVQMPFPLATDSLPLPALPHWRQDYAQIPDITMGPGEFLVVHIGVNGTNTTKDVYLPFMLTMQPISDLNLYRNSNFTNPGSMVHYVQWGNVPPTNRLSEALTAGLWTAGDFVPGIVEGHSIEYDGSGNLSTDWIDQPNPTIGF